MEPGLYKASFSGPHGSGFGVVDLNGEQFRGGDSVIAYTGSLAQTGTDIVAQLRTFRHSPGGVSVFGIDAVSVTLRGKAGSATSATLKADGVNFTVKLDRLAA